MVHTHNSCTTHTCTQSTPHTTQVHKAPHTIHTHMHNSSSDAHTHTSKCPGDKITQIPGDWEPLRAEEVSFHPSSEGLLSTYLTLPGPKGSVGGTAGTVSPGAHMESSLLPVIKWILMKTRALLLSQGRLSVLQGRCYRLALDKSVTIQPCEDSLRPGDAPSSARLQSSSLVWSLPGAASMPGLGRHLDTPLHLLQCDC